MAPKFAKWANVSHRKFGKGYILSSDKGYSTIMFDGGLEITVSERELKSVN